MPGRPSGDPSWVSGTPGLSQRIRGALRGHDKFRIAFCLHLSPVLATYPLR